MGLGYRVCNDRNSDVNGTCLLTDGRVVELWQLTMHPSIKICLNEFCVIGNDDRGIVRIVLGRIKLMRMIVARIEVKIESHNILNLQLFNRKKLSIC